MIVDSKKLANLSLPGAFPCPQGASLTFGEPGGVFAHVSCLA